MNLHLTFPRRALLGALLAASFAHVQAACFDDSLRRGHTAEEIYLSDEAVVDLVTGLEWQRCPLGATLDVASGRCAGTPLKLAWDAALREAAAANAGSGVPAAQQWRVPNIKELQSHLDTACYRPAVRPDWYPDTPSDAFWSSTPDPRADAERQAPLLYINLEDGLNYTPSFSGAAYVRLVRSLRP